MSFLTKTDYRSQISERDLQALTLLDDMADTPEEVATALREEAEQLAITEISSYLRGRFDMPTAFAAEGDDRNKQLVMMTVDVTIWNLCSKVAFANVSEIREIRYKAAIKWLERAERGLSNPDLPRYPLDPEKPNTRKLFRFGSNPVRSQSF